MSVSRLTRAQRDALDHMLRYGRWPVGTSPVTVASLVVRKLATEGTITPIGVARMRARPGRKPSEERVRHERVAAERQLALDLEHAR